MSTDFTNREKECFKIISQIPKDKKYLIIGGYAVTSFGFPRFSVNLDITIPKEELDFFKKILKENNFILKKEKDDLSYSGRFERYEKGNVSVDLIINGVQSRQTDYIYPFDYIFKNSEIRETIGWDPTNKIKVRIAKKEMLIALKIHSMRTADKRDIIMLCYKEPKKQVLIKHLMNCPKEKIIDHIDELLDVMRNKNLKDSIKGVYSIDDKLYSKAIINCKETLEFVKNMLTCRYLLQQIDTYKQKKGVLNAVFLL